MSVPFVSVPSNAAPSVQYVSAFGAPAGATPMRSQSLTAQKFGQSYGAPAAAPNMWPKTFRRGRMNVVAILLCFLAPVILFGVVSWSMAMRGSDEHRGLCITGIILGGLFVALCLYFALDARQRRRLENISEPNWNTFLFLFAFFAFFAAVFWGQHNYASNMRPYTVMTSLNSYVDVNVTRTPGAEVMDAGTLVFAPGTTLDISKSMGFRSTDVYCVAPLALGNAVPEFYDYWAVGVNCCSGLQPDFACPGASNLKADSGLRLMSESDRPYYRLAVQQAEAAFKIRAKHPLFFKFVQDAPGQVRSWSDHGVYDFMIGFFAFLVFQAFFVAATAIAFSKLVPH